VNKFLANQLAHFEKLSPFSFQINFTVSGFLMKMIKLSASFLWVISWPSFLLMIIYNLKPNLLLQILQIKIYFSKTKQFFFFNFYYFYFYFLFFIFVKFKLSNPQDPFLSLKIPFHHHPQKMRPKNWKH